MKLIVVAKEPVPGRVKTRLCPPCTPEQAAQLAAAALTDTLAAAHASNADEVVLVLDGRPGPWMPPSTRVVAQRGTGLASRLANGWADVGGPALQIGMDTPQVTPALLDTALGSLDDPAVTALLGAADDGGWWAIGLRTADPSVFSGVPMSRPDTGSRQLERLGALGYRVGRLPRLVDVDTIGDARAVAAAHPATRFARCLAPLERAVA